MCLKCVSDIPRTRFHDDPQNIVSQLFWGRTQIEQATAFYYFRKGSKYQRLIHELKYKSKQEIGIMIGSLFGTELKQTNYTHVDVIIPVPLHKSKLKLRGYNQSDFLCQGLSEALNKPVIKKCLVREVATDTQTRRSRYSRWENVEGIFNVVDPDLIKHKHVLLVDDVVTTGATLEACSNAILKVTGTKVSIATMAVAVN
jgi:ComF family protein